MIQKIINLECEELYAALMVHGGVYEWNPDEPDECPVIAVNPERYCPCPFGVKVHKAYVNQCGVLQIEGVDLSDGKPLTVYPDDVFAGQLSFITLMVPATPLVASVATEHNQTAKNNN